MGRNSELIRQWTLLRQLAATRTNTIRGWRRMRYYSPVTAVLRPRAFDNRKQLLHT
jgi:hypothetical protein